MPASELEQREILDGLPVVGGHIAVDFVNTLLITLKKDYLASFASAVAWFDVMGLLSEEETSALSSLPDDGRDALQALAGLHELRHVLHELIYAIADGRSPDPAFMEQFRRLHADASTHLGLRWVDGDGRFALDVESDDPRVMLWRMTRLAADLVTTPHHGRLRGCGRRPDCDWVFLDTSKNGRRRWCTPHICGNRMRLRSFVARHAASA